MTNSKRSSWQDIHQEILRRIRTRQWSPGDWIPNEEDLALEFGCARATVNRALREAAEAGLLDRKRKAGTRVTPQPAHKAVFRIPILRQEIQDLGGEHSYRLVSRSYGTPTLPVAKKMGVSREAELLRLQSLHFADTKPFVF
ncbi:MAG: GntR family transcriptional regulator, partial [Planctomycetota bacterium]